MKRYTPYEIEQKMERIEADVRRYIGQLGARCALLEAALRVIMKHNLLDDLVAEYAKGGENPLEQKPELSAKSDAA